MKWPWRTLGKWGLLGAATGAIAMSMSTDEEQGRAENGRAKPRQVAMASPRPAEALERAPVVKRVELERLLGQGSQPDSGKEIGNAFNATSWYVPPPPSALPPPPPPKPMAPPLPFTYLGHFKSPDSPADIIILSWAERVYTVTEGEVINGTYRVGPVMSGRIEFTYLPLDIKQSLNADMSS
ncbi:MAG: hypothetical protein A3F73_06225 [Gallionellales bacterium RIFCSPLOWO2_12_FULL_59_22]|nr:MAG: hypothetical protein A3H99_02305 [Gallionellales bacterium RIFCSPLOWO2_02_FULL_59_110]OGT01888.1 MAG: hypothetical protein A2Z65_10470 [Gallionellales bacterium RIFCSPLOWO2_02_58_13]OGT10648.1 MAG: hypothetical protein A3F73_06225 [Gallionellales bacterium RIFCSPLOWO2_12_FULL_59_22]